MYSDARLFKGVHVSLAITDWHDRPCGARQEKIILVQREKIISVQQAKKAMAVSPKRLCEIRQPKTRKFPNGNIAS
jgi:hypothetical protein